MAANTTLKYLSGLALLLFACDGGPSPPLSPERSLANFEIASGFKIELVASEPMVQDPVVIQFDENGKLWVVEMRGFMPDIEGNGEDAPVGRISILTDQDQDGRMDHTVIFADSLVLPRALAIVEGGALVAEDQVLWYMEDVDGDLQADQKILVDANYGIKGVVEHAPNGLWRGMDNWFYNAKADFRYKKIANNWVKDSTEFRGQWGMSHDNYGRLIYNYNWSQLHMDLVPPNYFSANPNHQPASGIDYSVSMDRQIFPIRDNPAINRGYILGTLDEQGRLVEFTSACAPYVYRGHIFNPGLVGDVFVCEPTGNLIKHNKLTEHGLYPTAENAYHQTEFLASRDERFRPVWLTSGPDGALYIADMYRGIIQHGLYMSDFLKEVTLERKLDQHINLGRIWRIIPASTETPKPPLLLSEVTTEELVNFLGNSNGWYRDMAQRLLIEQNQSEAIDLLRKTVMQSENEFARLHALWTLEGLGYQDGQFYIKVLEDDFDQVQIAALRILEPMVQGQQMASVPLEKALSEIKSEAAALQLALSARVVDQPYKHQLLLKIITEHVDSQLFRDAVMSSIADEEFQLLNLILGEPDWQLYSSNREIMIELLSSAIANKRDAEELIATLGIVDVASPDWTQRAIITGLSFSPTSKGTDKIALSSPPGILTGEFDKELNSKIDKLSQLYAWPGQTSIASRFPTDSVEEASPEVLAQGRNIYLSICANCHGNNGKGLPRFAPPLVDSEWVLGDPERLTRILLHGMEGPIEVNGKVYDSQDILPVMPAFNSTPAGDLAAVMTYIRQEWGHQASPVEPGTVGRLRVMTQGKVTPWTAEELLQ